MNTNKRKTLLATFVALFAAGATTQGAMAQTESATEQSKIDEIIVTASKRATSLQDTALSVSAISGADLNKLGVTSFDQIMNTIPGATLIEMGPGFSRLTFRGISTSSFASGNKTTATYIDEFPFSLGDSDIKLVDMAQVEVLKGPQGTLYGQSAMGGVMRYITNKPNFDTVEGGFDASTSSVADGDTGYQGNGYLNIRLSDNLALRTVLYQYDNPGFIDNIGTGTKNINKEEVTGGRLALRWGISDRAEFNLLYLNQTQRIGGGQADGFQAPTSTYTPVLSGAPTDLSPPDLDNPTFRSNIDPFQELDFEAINVKLDINFESFDLSIMAATKQQEKRFEWDASLFIGVYDDVTTTFKSDLSEFDTNTFEARLVSTGDGPIEWIAGVWYEKEEGDRPDSSVIRTPRTDLIVFGVPMVDGDLFFDRDIFDDSEELALYGEVGYRFTDKAKFTVGYRRANLKLDSGVLRADGVFDAFVAAGSAAIGDDESTEEDVDVYKFHFEYTFNEDMLGYAVASSGYRAGGFNRGGIRTPSSKYESDSLWNYEVGVRSSWLDNRLIVNTVAYYIDWTDIQLRAFALDALAQRIQNVGKASSLGLETEIRYQATESLQLSVNYGYIDATLDSDVETNGTILAEDGDRLPGSNKHNVSVFADWQMPITSELDIQANVSYSYVSSRRPDLANRNLSVSEAPSGDVVNLSAGLSHQNGVSVSLYANNLFDDRNIQVFSGLGTALEVASMNRPRTVGIRAGYKF